MDCGYRPQYSRFLTSLPKVPTVPVVVPRGSNAEPFCFFSIELPFHSDPDIRSRLSGGFKDRPPLQFLRGYEMNPPADTTISIPKWTSYVVTELGGRDPLGLSRLSFMITDYLVSGIITTTSRARYYSFYPWALWHI